MPFIKSGRFLTVFVSTCRQGRFSCPCSRATTRFSRIAKSWARPIRPKQRPGPSARIGATTWSRTQATLPTRRRPPPMKLLSFSDRTRFFKLQTVSNSELDFRVKPNIKDLSFQELAAFLGERKQPAYRAKQIRQWLFQKRAAAFREM